MMDLSPDRAPTQGHSNFTVTDGTVVIDTAPGDYTTFAGLVTNVLTGTKQDFTTIGTCTTLDGTETTGVLEHRSGITRTGANLNLGFCNGSVNNSTTRLSPTLRVTGGRLLVGDGAGTNSMYVGVETELGFPGSLAGKESTCNAGDPGLIAGWGRCPGEGNSCPLQYSSLGNPMDRGA